MNSQEYNVQKEASLAILPEVRKEFFITLDTIAQQILDDKELSEKQRDDMNMVYSELQSLDMKFIHGMHDYMSRDMITMDELLVVTSFFLTTCQKHPAFSTLADKYYKHTITPEEMTKLSESDGTMPHLKKFLTKIYEKIG